MGEINFGSFPRSGNHFVRALITKTLPNHQYNFLNHIAYYLNQKPNTFTTIRNPLDCVTSWIANSEDCRIDRAEKTLEWYINFYETVQSYKIPVISFTDLTNQPLQVVDYLCELFKFEKPLIRILELDETNPSTYAKTTNEIKNLFPNIREDVIKASNYKSASALFEGINKCSITTL